MLTWNNLLTFRSININKNILQYLVNNQQYLLSSKIYLHINIVKDIKSISNSTILFLVGMENIFFMDNMNLEVKAFVVFFSHKFTNTRIIFFLRFNLQKLCHSPIIHVLPSYQILSFASNSPSEKSQRIMLEGIQVGNLSLRQLERTTTRKKYFVKWEYLRLNYKTIN